MAEGEVLGSNILFLLFNALAESLVRLRLPAGAGGSARRCSRIPSVIITRQPYYLARVAVDRAALPAGITMTAGMPADVMIVTGERTLLQYLLRPITDTLRRGLRES